MKFFLWALGMLIFCLFWFVSTPCYLINDFCQWVDDRLSRFLDDLWEGL